MSLADMKISPQQLLLRPIRTLATTAAFFIILLVCTDTSARDHCEELISCNDSFDFDRTCFKFSDGHYYYPFAAQCIVRNPKIPALEIVESFKVSGSGTTTPKELRRLLGIHPGYHCNQSFFSIRDLSIHIALKGNADSPIVVQGDMMPSFCFRFDGRKLRMQSIEVRYFLHQAPALIRAILDHQSVRKTIDKKVSAMIGTSTIDLLAILGLSE